MYCQMYNFQSAVFEQFLFLILTIFKLISSCVHPKFYVYKSRNLAVYNTIMYKNSMPIKLKLWSVFMF